MDQVKFVALDRDDLEVVSTPETGTLWTVAYHVVDNLKVKGAADVQKGTPWPNRSYANPAQSGTTTRAMPPKRRRRRSRAWSRARSAR